MFSSLLEFRLRTPGAEGREPRADSLQRGVEQGQQRTVRVGEPGLVAGQAGAERGVRDGLRQQVVGRQAEPARGVVGDHLSPCGVRAVVDVDLLGVLALARVAVPALLRRPAPRSGRFLAVASTAANRGLPLLAAYCVAKAGVTCLVRALAVELGGTGVTANAVSPGSIGTAMLDESARLYGLASAQEFARQQRVGRVLAPAEVAAALLWLAGESSSAVTGADVPVDAGLSL